ncbi:pyridoxal phosphate-dependent aminotransferase [Pararhodospirillum oryzae]|uniref:Histidinol-phosphate aminotransferase n=1 Tax=Pararhodospirillum oryzae TaxID=478448 RepID=A0A512H6Y1_9PROT|nr:histidinol-phosphate transaminase [Pararhodospirillum oryzae]GEO81207.1 histidinol-phosphate aminotransferase [Pararhodospirillum oryzae]
MPQHSVPQPRPGIMDISPYVGGESSVPGVSRIIKLASNEGALGASPRAREALARVGATAHLYPDGGSVAVREAIGRRFGLDPARIVCGAGSDELIGLLVRAYAGPGDTIVQSAYGFLMYAIYARSAGVEPLLAPETNLTTDIDAMLATVKPSTRLVFLANPNNPTGTLIDSNTVRRLREGLRDDIILVLDSAYAEFVGRNDYDPGQALVDSHPNTVMLRTFSKIHGMGGLRLGWAYGPEHIIDVLNRMRGPFNVSSAAQVAGEAAIADVAFQQMAQEHNTYWRTWTAERLRGLGLTVTDSACNFLLVHFDPEGPRSVAPADAYLRQNGLICRRVAGYGLPHALRITIGRDDEMQFLIETLTAFMDGGGSA